METLFVPTNEQPVTEYARRRQRTENQSDLSHKCHQTTVSFDRGFPAEQRLETPRRTYEPSMRIAVATM